ncbi:MAG: hypothetical protein AAGA60_32570 [Cyanobacteria bacterium P01_E01_bin.42]
MSLAASIHDLKILVQSFHPIIAMETVEEERVENVLKAVTGDMKIPLFEWTVSRGLYLSPGSSFSPQMNDFAAPDATQITAYDNTQKPLEVLRYIENRDRRSVYLLKDFSDYLRDDEVSRQVRELVRQLRNNRGTLVLTGSKLDLPSAIAHESV